MIFPSNRVRILVATRPVDFGKGHDGLAALVKNELRKEPEPRRVCRRLIFVSYAATASASRAA
ncbi:IS66 Orf2 like protein (plasmid) [Roseivivax sp. THAF40]|nr:IS66 Orf2 like protein [Roseivivax sp. THAF40]QFT65027.1 IS66 Orf2 like protein [Roseivivax sp. THAF30]